MKKIFKKNIIIIIYIIYVILNTMIIIVENVTKSKEEITKYPWTIIIVVIMSLLSEKNIMATFFFIIIKVAKRNVIKEKLSKIDIEKYRGYYRDIIEKCSPAVLSYIDDFNFDFDRYYAITILSLKLKGLIDIVDNKIITKTNSNIELDENEEYVLNNLNNISDKIFKQKILKDAKQKGLIESREDKKEYIKNIFKIVIIAHVIPIFIEIILFMMIEKGVNEVLFISLFIACILIQSLSFLIINGYLVYYLVYSHKKTADPYFRTKEGIRLNESLEGLKNYLRDFSNLDEKDEKDLKLWDEYLIYSVMFKQNTKIINKILSLKYEEDKV